MTAAPEVRTLSSTVHDKLIVYHVVLMMALQRKPRSSKCKLELTMKKLEFLSFMNKFQQFYSYFLTIISHPWAFSFFSFSIYG